MRSKNAPLMITNKESKLLFLFLITLKSEITPVWLKKAYSREPAATNETSEAAR
jgi:hypothetical protein